MRLASLPIILLSATLAACQSNVLSQSLGLTPDSQELPDSLQDDLNRANLPGNADARYSLGEAYERGRGVPRDFEKAVYWYERAAAESDPVWSVLALKTLGLMYEDQTQPGVYNLVSAASAYSRCADYNDDDCLEDQLRLSQYPEVYVALNPLIFGPPAATVAPLGLTQALDYVQSGQLGAGLPALEWHARSGSALAQYKLSSVRAEKARGRVTAESSAWLYLAAKGGVPEAQTELAKYYLYNEEIYVPSSEIIEWFNRSALQGDPESMYQLGLAYSKWLPANERDFHLAFNFFSRAAERGHLESLVSVGDMFKSGIGTLRDDESAREAYSKAASGGNDVAIARLSKYYPTASVGNQLDKQTDQTKPDIDRTESPMSAAALYRLMANKIHSVRALKSKSEKVSSGTGFVFSRYLITNHHVIEGADVFLSSAKKWVDAEDSDVIEWRLIIADEAKDLALLTTIDPNGWRNLEGLDFVPRNDHLEIGQIVYALGAPSNFDKTITSGIVSGKRDQLELASMSMDGAITRSQIREYLEEQDQEVKPVRFVQHTATISPGSSGGPLFDAHGRLVGVNTWLIRDTGINMAVSNMDLYDFLDEGFASGQITAIQKN